MPFKPKKPCHAPGCRNLVKGTTYCERHSHLSSSKFQNKKGKVHPWYNSRIWKAIRAQQLRKQPLCEDCLEQGLTKAATVVDHKIDWKDGKTELHRRKLFESSSNLRSLCESHHNAKTARTNKK